MRMPLALLLLVPAVPVLAQRGAPDAGEPADVGLPRPPRRVPGLIHPRAPGPLGIPPAREASGTAWQPDVTPAYLFHGPAGRGALLITGNVFVHYIEAQSERGDGSFGSINWLRVVGRGPLAGGELELRGMLSLEPFTLGDCGYPDLLATGGLCEELGLLHDRQAPRDLFMEAALSYSRPFDESLAWEVYGGVAGEPALGPVPYPHRISSLINPIAPIGHHGLDSTRTASGVLTVGLFGPRWKVEGSLFDSRAPDADRLDLDLDVPDSYAGRVWLVPVDHWAVQASLGRLDEAATNAPAEARDDVLRASASATGLYPFGALSYWTATAAWGRNVELRDDTATDAFLLETTLDLEERDVVFGRLEVVQKTGRDLALGEPMLDDSIFRVAKAQFGYVRQIGPVADLLPGLGGSMSVGFLPRGLERFYGARRPVGWAVFAVVRPARLEQVEDEMDGAVPHEAVFGP